MKQANIYVWKGKNFLDEESTMKTVNKKSTIINVEPEDQGKTLVMDKDYQSWSKIKRNKNLCPRPKSKIISEKLRLKIFVKDKE